MPQKALSSTGRTQALPQLGDQPAPAGTPGTSGAGLRREGGSGSRVDRASKARAHGVNGRLQPAPAGPGDHGWRWKRVVLGQGRRVSSSDGSIARAQFRSGGIVNSLIADVDRESAPRSFSGSSFDEIIGEAEAACLAASP